MRLVLMRPPDSEWWELSFSATTLATSELIRRAENPLAFIQDRRRWLLSVGMVNLEYLRLLIYPNTLCIEYSYDCVPLAVDDAPLLLFPHLLPPFVLLWIAIFACALALYNAVHTAHARRTLIAASWLLMPWLPISHLPLRLGNARRRAHIIPPLHRIHPPRRECHTTNLAASSNNHQDHYGGWPPRVPPLRSRRLRTALLVGLLIGLLSARTLIRTIDWRSDASAFESAILACPRSAKLHQNMCTLRTGQRRFSEAKAHCDLAEEIDITHCDTKKSRAFLHLAEDDIGGAIREFNGSLSCVYTNMHAYRVLMTLYDALYNRDQQNASLHEDMATTQLAVGNVAYAARLMRRRVHCISSVVSMERRLLQQSVVRPSFERRQKASLLLVVWARRVHCSIGGPKRCVRQRDGSRRSRPSSK